MTGAERRGGPAGQGGSRKRRDGEAGGLGQRLDRVIDLLEQGTDLQRLALLGPGAVLDFAHRGEAVRLALPDAPGDYIQRTILRKRNFYEARLLAEVAGMGLVGPRSLVCDVGANIGNHSVHFGRILRARRVLSFEPQPHCHAVLRRNLDLNGLDPGDVRRVMLGARAGTGALVGYVDHNMGGAAFAPAEGGAVPMTTLDAEVAGEDLATLDLVKIDVEGMQMEVLRGMTDILARRRPPIWVELLQNEDAYDETATFLTARGYGATRLGPNDFVFRAG